MTGDPLRAAHRILEGIGEAEGHGLPDSWRYLVHREDIAVVAWYALRVGDAKVAARAALDALAADDMDKVRCVLGDVLHDHARASGTGRARAA